MIKECYGIRPLRTMAALGRNNAAYKAASAAYEAAYLISISLFVIKSAPILVTRTHQPVTNLWTGQSALNSIT